MVLGPYNPDNGNTRVEFKAEITQSRAESQYSVTITVYARRTTYWASGTDGTLNLLYYIGSTSNPVYTAANRYTTIYGNEGWVKLGSYTHSGSLSALASSSLVVGFGSKRTYTDGPLEWNVGVKSTTLQIAAYAGYAALPSVDSIADNGDNTFTVTVSPSSGGTNNSAVGHSISYILDGVTYKSADYSVSGGKHIYKQAIPKLSGDGTVLVTAQTVTKYKDNPASKTKTATLKYYGNPTVLPTAIRTEAEELTLEAEVITEFGINMPANVKLTGYVLNIYKKRDGVVQEVQTVTQDISEWTVGDNNYTYTIALSDIEDIAINDSLYASVKYNTYNGAGSCLTDGVYTSNELVVTSDGKQPATGVNIYVKINGSYKSGRLYARASRTEPFKPAKEFYYRNSVNDEFKNKTI